MSEPTICPPCRQQRRMAHANQMILYKRKCDATGKDVVSAYPPESPYKVFSQPYWLSDQWDGTTYGQEFDFNRPFFEQWNELNLRAPHPALQTAYSFNENSEYTNHAGYDRQCDKCGIDIKTTYSPDSPWTVYCEKDYLESLE